MSAERNASIEPRASAAVQPVVFSHGSAARGAGSASTLFLGGVVIAVTVCRYDRPQSGGRSGTDSQQSLSVRQDPVGQPAETDPPDGPYLNTARDSRSPLNGGPSYSRI